MPERRLQSAMALLAALVAGCTSHGRPSGSSESHPLTCTAGVCRETSAGQPIERHAESESDDARAKAGAAGGQQEAGPETGDASAVAPAGRRCDEGMDHAAPSWQRIETGLDDFVFGTDGRDPAQPRPNLGPRGLAGVAFGNGVFLIVGGGNSGEDAIRYATSGDGVHWELESIASMHGEIGSVSRVFFAQGRFVFTVTHEPRAMTPTAVLYSSSDARSWSRHPLSGALVLFDLASDGERTVLATGNLSSSTDFESWSEMRFDHASTRDGFTGIAFGSGRWVASAVRASVVDGVYRGESAAYGSSDALVWDRIELPGTSYFSVVHGAGLWIAANTIGEYRTSRDGLSFVETEPSGAWTGPGRPDHRVRRAGDRFISIATDRAQQPPSQVRIISTTDGSAWEDFGSVPGLALPDGAVTIEYTVQDVAYSDCRYVAAGDYSVIVPGAIDPPPFTSEIGPFLITADLAQR